MPLSTRPSRLRGRSSVPPGPLRSGEPGCEHERSRSGCGGDRCDGDVAARLGTHDTAPVGQTSET